MLQSRLAESDRPRRIHLNTLRALLSRLAGFDRCVWILPGRPWRTRSKYYVNSSNFVLRQFIIGEDDYFSFFFLAWRESEKHSHAAAFNL